MKPVLDYFARLAIVTILFPGCGGGGGGGGAGPGGPSSGGFFPGFGTGGVVLGDPLGPMGNATSIAIDSTWMYVAGSDPNIAQQGWRIEKRGLLDGALDPGFGTGGSVISDPTINFDYAFAIALDGGSIYVGGVQNAGADQAWRIEKRSAATGAPDPTFGGGTGVVTVNPTTVTDTLSALAVNGGAIFVVGYEGNPAPPGTDVQWRIEKRSASTGALDGVFGVGTGIVRSNPGTAQDEARAVALDGTSIYVAGLQHLNSGDYAWRIEKRDRGTGALDGTFGTGSGAVTSNPSSNSYDEAQELSLSGSSLFIAGTHEFSSDRQWRLEKRDTGTGTLDPVFGGGTGFVTSNSGTVNEAPAGSVLVDGAFVYVAGWYDGTALLDIAWRIEKRDASTGALVPSFGNGGAVTSDPTTGQDHLNGMAFDSTALYAVGYQSDGPGIRRRIEKRLK